MIFHPKYILLGQSNPDKPAVEKFFSVERKEGTYSIIFKKIETEVKHSRNMTN